ncbi:MAG TPA: glycosyltransferase [Thermoanaerobaculia bacterium]|nr:glycosyltransferase [Thermoanaerobaculia bacterium]
MRATAPLAAAARVEEGLTVPAPPRTVAHLIKGLGRGGAEVLLRRQLAAGRDGRRHLVGYFLPHKDALVPALLAEGCDVRLFAARSPAAILARVPQIARWLRSEGVELLHCHLPLAGVAGRLAGRLARVPVVYTEHNVWERYRRATRWANRATWRLQDLVVAVSAEVAASVARHAGTGVPVVVTRNGVALPPHEAGAHEAAARRTQARRALGLALDAPVVGTVAVFRRQKRLDHWLEVAERVRRRHPDVSFLLVGDGPLRAELQAVAAARGLGDAVRWTGLLEDPAPALAALDVFLTTSEYEGLPVALLEAMAASLPVVATAVGGVPEVIEPGVSGSLHPFGDLAGMADAVGALLADPAARARLGTAARRRVEAELTIERMAGELAALYAGVCAGRRHGG